MAKKLTAWKTKGMNRDLSVSAFNPEFSFENMNLRLLTNEGNTLMSWVNEKGTSSISIVEENDDGSASSTAFTLSGTPIGTAVLNHYLVIFTKAESYDYIYRLKYTDSLKTILQCKQLWRSASSLLKFSVDNPLETLVSYESELVQKVYWTDGIEQPRVINIKKDYSNAQEATPIYNPFDFVRELQLNETVKVEKQLSASGMFAPGVIQYAFTYYDKYGQESNIFYTSPLQYISYKERGASPEDKVENAFVIKVNDVDRHFDYLRIYSIQRTSINGTPICKRIQDIDIQNITDVDGHYNVSYTDTGTSGDSVDPTELLYKGGDIVAAKTLEQKDGTLFMGGLSLTRPSIASIKSQITFGNVSRSTRSFLPVAVSLGSYKYYNQLTSNGNETRHTGMTVPCGGFKTGETYRLGVQFQHKSGKWSDPIRVRDIESTGVFSESGNTINVPNFSCSLSGNSSTILASAGYKKMRPVVVFPNMIDRTVICQGIVAPVITPQSSSPKDLQSSWFFRPYGLGTASTTVNTPTSSGALEYTKKDIEGNNVYDPSNIRKVEIQGNFSTNKLYVSREYRTFHSPDIEFDEQVSLVDFTNKKFKNVGTSVFQNTLADIDIQTETPTVSNVGTGFVHKSFNSSGAAGIVTGLFYDDFIVDDKKDDEGSPIGAYAKQKQACKWLIYPWQGSGSLNNDINRPADKGIGTSKLKKKIISNLRFADTVLTHSGTLRDFSFAPQIFSGDEVSILKFQHDSNDLLYKGNIDTVLNPDDADGCYFCYGGWPNVDSQTPFESTDYCKTYNKGLSASDENGIRKWDINNRKWVAPTDHDDADDIGDAFVDLVIKKLPVKMKYKSTPHLFGYFDPSYISESNNALAVVDIQQTVTPGTRFGGDSADALRENIWVPCGEPVGLSDTIYWDYGDTYFQRYDCLKTYPFTREDSNQIVEIGSFMLETRVNIDGRYDRNRGQSSNLNMHPGNFNLINKVYSQIDNFFSYRIQPDDFYTNTIFPNQVTWSKTKESGADVDTWTNVTLASSMELDGNKGEITAIRRFNNQLIAFQDSGISQILYNENAQLSTTQGVPVEIGNSGKVDGKRYLSDTIGCSNKWAMVNTPLGIYFMDSNEKSIYLFNGQLNNISQAGGFNSWCKSVIPPADAAWTPFFYEISQTDLRSAFIAHYDKLNQEVLWINGDTALAWNEKLQTFTSFYDYSHVPFFCNLDDTGIWLKANHTLWKHQAGDYCKFFGTNKPYWMTLVGNPEPQTDKIFTNLEFRASVEGDGSETNGKFIPTLPFDSLETWDEYQHGITTLENKNGHAAMIHGTASSALQRKFRIWRCDIPRDNYAAPETDAVRGISRFTRKPNDRMRNPWLYLKLMKNAATSGSLHKAEIHDLIMTYFN